MDGQRGREIVEKQNRTEGNRERGREIERYIEIERNRTEQKGTEREVER